MDKKKKFYLVLMQIFIMIIVFFASGKYHEYQSNKEEKESVMCSFMDMMAIKLKEFTILLQDVNDWEEDDEAYPMFLCELKSMRDICMIYRGCGLYEEDYFNEIDLASLSLHTALTNGLTVDYGIGNKISFMSLLNDDKFSDSEKEFLSQIRKDFDIVYKRMTDFYDVTLGEIKVYPTNEELNLMVEPLSKYNYSTRQWTVKVSN